MYIGLHVTVIFDKHSSNLHFLERFSNNPVSNFMKIHLVGAELFHADRHDKVNSQFS